VKLNWDSFLPPGFKIFIKPGITDMRKSIHTLGYLVEAEMNLDLLGDSIFIFSNKRKDTIKILYWDGTGFCLWQKKLDQNKFPFPENDQESQELSRERFLWLLRGIDFRREHRLIKISKVI
jgi:transposase